MATDLAEEQRRVAQRCGTEAAEDWGLTRHDTTRHDTTRHDVCAKVPSKSSKSSNSSVPPSKAEIDRFEASFMFALWTLNTSQYAHVSCVGHVGHMQQSCITCITCIRCVRVRRRTVRPHHPLPSGNPRVSRMFGP